MISASFNLIWPAGVLNADLDYKKTIKTVERPCRQAKMNNSHISKYELAGDF